MYAITLSISQRPLMRIEPLMKTLQHEWHVVLYVRILFFHLPLPFGVIKVCIIQITKIQIV